MYLNKYPSSYEREKEAARCNKIFRPWDNADGDNKNVAHIQSFVSKGLDDCAQDATISTTTENEDNQAISSEKCDAELTTCKIADTKDTEEHRLKGFRKLQTKENSRKKEKPPETALLHRKFLDENIESLPPLPDYPGNLEGYPVYPEFVHVNLAHTLGLTPTDPLFLECVNQGCTLEEYTRVMSQEHQAKILSARKQRPKKYRCPHCDVGFSNNGQLKGHIRIHTGERPFRCDENNCGKTFTRNEELTRHKRIHSGLRPFPCTHCGKRFGRKDHLKKHSRTHFQPRGLYAVPVMLPFETWTASPAYPYVPMFTY